MPDVLFRGPIPGISAWLMPVAHGLLQALEDVEKASKELSCKLWQKQGEAASVGWHLLHLAGSTDRLVAYALGRVLTDEQRAWLQLEREQSSDLELEDLLGEFRRVIESSLQTLRGLADETLLEPRFVGAARLPSTTLGLLVHASEHAQRHSGQIFTTIKIAGLRSP